MKHTDELPPGLVGPASGDDSANSRDALLLATLPWGVILLGAADTVLHLNPQAATWWGVASADAQGQPLPQVGRGSLPELLYDALRRAAAGERQPVGKYYLPATGQWLAMTSQPMPTGVVVHWQDITAQKQREQQYQALADNTPDTLSRWNPELQLLYANPAFATQAGQPLAGLLGRTSAEIFRPAAVADSWLAGLRQAFATGQPQELAGSWQAPAAGEHYQTRLVPELRDGQVDAVLAITRNTNTQWHSQQATQETLRLKEALAQRATDKYHALFESMDQGFCLLDVLFDEAGQQAVDYRYLELNPTFTQQSGMPAEVLGKTIRELVPDLEPFWFDLFGRVVRTGESVRLERYVPQLNRWSDVHAFRAGPAEAHQVAVLFTDITARRRHEANLAFLAEVSEALAHLTDIDSTLNALGEKLASYLGLSACAFAELQEAAQVGVIHHGWHRADLPDLRGTYRMREFMTDEVLRSCQAGEAVVVRDVFADPRTDGAQYAALHIHSFVSMPLVRDGEWRYLLVVYRAEPHNWRDDEIELLRELTARIWTRLERARAEQALRASEGQFRAVANLVPDLLWRSAPNSETTWYNQRWYEYTGQTPAEAVGYGWANVVHPDDRAESIGRYRAAVAASQSLYREHRIRSVGGEYRWFQVEARPLLGAQGKVTDWFGAATDIHARKQREQHQEFLLHLSDTLRAETGVAAVGNRAVQLLAGQLRADRVYLVTLSANDDTVTVTHETRRADLPPLQGAYRSSDFPAAIKEIFERTIVYDDVRTDARLTELDRLSFTGLGAVGFMAAPIRRGNEAMIWAAGVVSTQPRAWTTAEVSLFEEAIERTWAAVERARVEEALATSEKQFRLLVTATSDAVHRMGADWTQMEQLVGGDFLVDTQDPTRTWLATYIPADDQPLVQAAIAEAIRHQRLFELEHRVRRVDGTLGWVYSRANPVLDAQGTLTGWLGTARDVSARKEMEQQLQESASLLERRVTERTQELRESRDLLHAIAEAQSAYVNAFEAIRDESGHIVDLKFIFVNSITTRVDGGRPLVGRRYLEAFPEAESSGLLDTFRRVIETGVGEDQEAFYDDGQLTGWFRNNATRLGDGVLAIGEDITARKQAEQARTQALRLLEQSEAVARMGTWVYDLATHALTWSDGMYQLLDLPPGSAVSLPVYLERVVPEDRALAEQLLRHLQAGASNAGATLRLQVGDAVKTVRVKAVLLPGEDGRPGRVLGVDLDISDVQRLEADNLALQLNQQQALLLAVLQTQETERNRLAESLHNGLGQLLYAIKLQVSQLDVPALHELPALNEVRAYADRLLADAIRQTRTLSHELMPTRLTERGLGAALRDICRDLSAPQLHFTCHVWLNEQEVSPPLQTALYRLAQELAHNIAKHAGATQAALEFELLPGWASLRAEDNGRGFDPATTAHGLGLRLLHETVELLGGTIALDSSPEYGTHIRLRIPIS